MSTQINHFKQIVNSFFNIHPEKGEAELYTYIELRTQVSGSEFLEWRKTDNRRKY